VLRTAPEPIAARIVRRALRMLHPPYAGDARDVAIVLAAGGEELSGGMRCERDGAHLAIYDPRAVPPPPAATPMPVPSRVDFGGVEVTSTAGSRPVITGDRRTAWLDAAHAGHLILRPAETGERIDLGDGDDTASPGHKPVRQAMAEAGIPPRLRPGWPVVSVHGKIAWIVGARVAGWASASPSTSGVRITMERR
jgi:tRNA(Ile)-lysidine synthetase-like protein